jgi:cell division protein FtsN
VETRGGDGRPILAARRSGRRRRVEGKRHAPAEEREGTVRLRGRMLDAQLTVESPRMKSAVAGERDESSAAAAAAAAKWSRTKRRSAAMPAALWREPNRKVGPVPVSSVAEEQGSHTRFFVSLGAKRKV